MSPRWSELPTDLAALHAAAMAAADPAAAVSRVLRLTPDGVSVDGEIVPLARGARLWLIAAGKAARGMAGAALAALGARVAGGVVAHPRGAPAAPGEPEPWPDEVELVPAAHPLPDAGSLAAGDAVKRLLAGTSPEDLVLVLLSGGASSLLERPRPGLSLDALRRVTAELQRAGADIFELNTVRRALSLLKGGGLSRLAAPARVVTLALSDVIGDRPEAIGSGPTVPSPTGDGEALRVLERTGVAPAMPEVVAALAEPTEPATLEGDAGIFCVVASNRQTVEAVARAADGRGFHSEVMTTFLQGEAREVGRMVGGCAASVRAHGVPVAAPACLIFGGETTVTVRGHGRGGRNMEVALGAALALAGCARAAVFSFATDGVDGPTDAAGAVATGDTVERAAALGLSPHRALAENDSEPFFRALGDLWETGPTGTNVNDLAVALVYP
jgi:hydroxypyruvate reductase